MTDEADRRGKRQWEKRGSWAAVTGQILTSMIVERSAAARSGEASDQCEQSGSADQREAGGPAAVWPPAQRDTLPAPAPIDDDRNN